MIFAAASEDVAVAFIELGAIALGLAVLARLSDRLGVSPIPAYLVAGLLFGEGGHRDARAVGRLPEVGGRDRRGAPAAHPRVSSTRPTSCATG